MSVRGYVNGTGRREQPDYPLEAVREVIVNAALHRDYSPVTRGTQIQGELHPDRLMVRSPGSLYGPMRLEDLGNDRETVVKWANPPGSTQDVVARELSRLGKANAAHLVRISGRSRPAVLKALRALIAKGVVETEGDSKSPKRAYPWAGTG